MLGGSEATMFGAVAEFLSTQPGDSADFMSKARRLAIGVARDYEPARLYVIRIDNWFGPRWMHFAGKAIGVIGVHQISPLHVPPFVPHRVVEERAFVGPGFEETALMPPLHIECSSSRALHRRIADIDKDATFVWFSGQSEPQRRGSVMVYLPVASDSISRSPNGLQNTGTFYVGFSQRAIGWEPAMLRGISRHEVANLDESGPEAVRML
jgi:hypothetical protein